MRTRYVVVRGSEPRESQVLRSCGEWLVFYTKQDAEEYAQQWDTASACYPEWQPATVFERGEIR